MKNNKYNKEYIIKYLDESLKKSDYNFKNILNIFNKYFENIFNNKFSKYKKEDNSDIYKIREYAMLNGGKRLRPFIMFLTTYCINKKNIKKIENYLLSIELIHTYSLIHDDLPCMDNDKIRRGKPSVWYKYGEDMGVLAGDSLLTDAFLVLLDDYVNIKAIKAIKALTYAASSKKLINGQIIDTKNTYKKNFSEKEILDMYMNKTGALFASAFEVAGHISELNDRYTKKLYDIGMLLGICFQIQDDLLEVLPNNKINKPKDSDKKNKKNTYVIKVGVEKSIHVINELKLYIYKYLSYVLKDNKKYKLFIDFIDYMIK